MLSITVKTYYVHIALCLLAGLYSSPCITEPVVPESVNITVLKQRTDTAFDDEWDWVQLTSGEWLKGKIKVIYNGEMEFDSENLGLLKFDTDSIQQAHTLQPQALRISGVEDPIIGSVTFTESTIEIRNDTLSFDFGRDRIITLVSGLPKEHNFWNVTLGLGASIRAGNSPQTEYNGNFSARRRTALSRFTFDYLGLYTYANNEETANNHRARSNFDIFANRKLFYRPLFLDLFSDRFQNIDTRGTFGAGLGLQTIDLEKMQWDYFIGPGMQFTQFNEVDDDREKQEKSAVLIATTHYWVELTDAIKTTIDYQIMWGNEESGGFTHHAIATLNHSLTATIDFNTSIIWDYTASPTADDLGETPKKDDYRFIFDVSYSFN